MPVLIPTHIYICTPFLSDYLTHNFSLSVAHFLITLVIRLTPSSHPSLINIVYHLLFPMCPCHIPYGSLHRTNTHGLTSHPCFHLWHTCQTLECLLVSWLDDTLILIKVFFEASWMIFCMWTPYVSYILRKYNFLVWVLCGHLGLKLNI